MKTATKVYLKLSASMLAILAFVLSLLFMMNFMKYQNITTSLISSRLSVIAESIEDSVHKTEQLGVSLQNMVRLQDLLDRAVTQDANLISASICSASGKILFSTMSGDVGGVLEEEWQKASKGAPEKIWYRNADDELIVGLQLTNQLGVFSGTIIMIYNYNAISSLMTDAWYSLLKNTLLLFAAFSVVGLAVGRVGFSELMRFYQFINAIEASKGRRIDSTAPSWLGDVEQKYTSANDRYMALDEEIKKIETGINATVKGGSDNG